MPPASLFSIRIALAILGLLFFQMNFMTAFSISMKKVVGILIYEQATSVTSHHVQPQEWDPKDDKSFLFSCNLCVCVCVCV